MTFQPRRVSSIRRRVAGLLAAVGVIVSGSQLALAQQGSPPVPPAPPAPATPKAPATPAKPASPPQPAAPAKAPVQPAAKADLPSVDALMDKYIEATGGKEAWAKMKTMSTTGELDIPASGIKGKMQSFLGEDGKSYSEIDLGGMGKAIEGSDGETVWSSEPGQGPRILTGEERDLRLTMAKLGNPLDWKKIFGKINVVGVEKVNDKDAYKVEGVTEVGAVPLTQFFDVESGLVTRMDITVDSPAGKIPMEMYPSDYREVGGLKFPYKSRRLMMQSIEMVETTSKIEVNPEIAKDRFELPDDVKALKEAAQRRKEKKDADAAKKPAEKAKPDGGK